MEKINRQQIVKITVVGKTRNRDYVFYDNSTFKPNFFQKYFLGKKEKTIKKYINKQ